MPREEKDVEYSYELKLTADELSCQRCGNHKVMSEAVKKVEKVAQGAHLKM